MPYQITASENEQLYHLGIGQIFQKVLCIFTFVLYIFWLICEEHSCHTWREMTLCRVFTYLMHIYTYNYVSIG